MYKLIEYLFEEIPNVTIILSTLLLNTNAGADERIRNIVNPQYEALVNSLQERQARIVLADLHPVVKAEELVNGTHPNDKGYEKLAEAWLGAIAEAGRKRLLVKPQNLGDPNINRPPKVGVHGNMGLFDSSKTFRDTHKATLSTVPTTHGNIPVAPTTSLGSTATPTKALPTPEVSCTRPVGQGPLEVGSQRPHCSILGKAPAYVSQILTSVVPQSNAARSNKPFWSGR
ncbi:carbohydrate esterase family 3 protein [Karstenula rhodostoma CBS 690.94]|uniref:Carbohydrate esterase family 3 protein n=1 Tax=Karstenula rhodostoma CBS 690.94 TaxID=1392251 RepID=A0A9P4PGJ5_9PLEO|nr:carbohydrate esterase family 3 protein [Karstenula rhodostoma CBS 690.94]